MAAELFKKRFSSDLQKIVWSKNDFIKHSKDDSSDIKNKFVELPHSGAAPGVTEDRAFGAQTPVQRVDSATEYQVHELSTDAQAIQYSEEMVVNYAKRASLSEEHGNALNENAALKIAHKWARGGDSENAWAAAPVLVGTTGTAERVTQLPQIGGTAVTGNRKRAILADLLSSVTVLNRQKVPQANRYGCITPDFLEDFLLIEEFSNSDYSDKKRLVDAGGETFRWLGINWYVRAEVNKFNTSGGLKLQSANSAAGDRAGSLIWHKDYVRRAEGASKGFLDLDNPIYQSDIISAATRYGAIGAKYNSYGIVNLVESAGA